MEEVNRLNHVCEHFERIAINYYNAGHISLAFQNYCTYFHSLIFHHPLRVPKLSSLINFSEIVCKLGSICEEIDKTEEALNVYRHGLSFSPNNTYILNSVGALLSRVGAFDAAFEYIQTAAHNNYYFPSHKNLLHLKWLQFPRWHFKMMNDFKRNEGYKKAISEAVKTYKNVYDIGSGVGLLSMIAATEGANYVVAIEENQTLANLSEKILDANNIRTVKVIKDNSVSLNSPPNPCNLIVTEIFDCGLFGEHAITTIHHALNTFITQSNFQIIPAKARCYVFGVESLTLRKRFRVCHTLPALNIYDNFCGILRKTKPYDNQNISALIKNQQAKIITDTVKFAEVNFESKEDLEYLLHFPNVFHIFHLKALNKGTLDSLVLYFELDLDKTNTLTTNPLDENRCKCWDNAVFYIRHPIALNYNDIINVVPRFECDRLTLNVREEMQCRQCIFLKSNDIAILNDENYCRFAVNEVFFNNFYKPCKLVYDTNVFPLFGLLAAKKGCRSLVSHQSHLRPFFQYIIKSNNILPLNLKIIIDKSVLFNNSFHEKLEYLFETVIHKDGSWQGLQLEQFQKASCPNSVYLNCCLIYSDYLNICNKVDNANVFNFKIREFVSEFTGDEHPCHYSTDYFIKMSETIEFDITDSNLFNFDGTVKIIKDGKVNGILYWFKIYGINKFYYYSTFYENEQTTSRSYAFSVKLMDDEKEVYENLQKDIHVEKYLNYLKIQCV